MARPVKRNILDLGERGNLNLNNKLNDLTGKEWIKFTKSWFIHRPPRRKNDEVLHPAKFPESLVEEFIRFFTKKNGLVLDPFMGTGSTLLAAAGLGRRGIGVEISEKYFNIARDRIRNISNSNGLNLYNASSLDLSSILEKLEPNDSLVDYTITSPPYWNQLERDSLRHKKRRDNGLDTKYSSDPEDLGNRSDYNEFLEGLIEVFDQVFDYTKPNGYLTVITNNIYHKSRLFPLAFDTAVKLTDRGKRSWTLKDEKIWLQDDKPLVALGINNAWVGNRHHQYCLNFRKESE
jgi:DNA modification methylase